MYDAHTHLNSDQLYPQRTTHLQSFLDIGGTQLVNIWVNHEQNLRAIDIAKLSWSTAKTTSHDTQKNKALATIWLHPCEISFWHITSHTHIDREMEQLKDLYHKNTEHIVGIGECGIDSHRERDDTIQDLQASLFHQQCTFAQEVKLPIIIHSRDNFSLTLEVIKNYPDLKVYFHCRWYSPKDINEAITHLPHLRIGFCGNLTYPKAKNIQNSFDYLVNIISSLPTNETKERNHIKKNLETKKDKTNEFNKGNPHILLETDAPYLSPQAVRGTQNEPAHIQHIYNRVAQAYPTLDIHTLTANAFEKLYL